MFSSHIYIGATLCLPKAEFRLSVSPTAIGEECRPRRVRGFTKRGNPSVGQRAWSLSSPRKRCPQPTGTSFPRGLRAPCLPLGGGGHPRDLGQRGGPKVAESSALRSDQGSSSAQTHSREQTSDLCVYFSSSTA